MGILLWDTISAKVNMVKSDISVKKREKETNKYIRENNIVCNPVTVITKEDLKYYINLDYNLIHIEGELYDILKKENYEYELKKIGKTVAKIGGKTGVATGVITGFSSPFTVPLLLTSLFVGVLSKSSFDKYDYSIEEQNSRIILRRKK